MLDYRLYAAGTTDQLLFEPAREVLWCVFQSIPRTASRLRRASLTLARDRDLRFVLDACDELRLD